ncbi:hypothetical protein [Solirhodobacter olei]|uniref:hypothetical protein n=1 Tax=Solirhodobacter olei TaxID=2493082 RepID=UPI000FD97E7E|nr:hypothetical protein [Solirhodobacter olei]
MRAFRLISFLLFAIFAAILGVQSLQLTGVTRLYPTVLIVAVILGTLGAALRELLSAEPAVLLHPEIARLLRLPGRSLARLLAFMALWLAYPSLLVGAGFIVATTVTLSASLLLLRLRRIGLVIAGSAVFAVCLAVLFATLFYIPTPSGFLDDAMTRLIYVLSRT